tara:strand:- start:9719 stop:10495 length:777 start_codon:yes stop_codon:yes gene_type:complete
MATLEDQLAIELQMCQAGEERYDKQVAALSDKGVESRAQHGKAIMGNVLAPLSLAIKEFCSGTVSSNRSIAYGKIKHLNPDRLAVLSLLGAIDKISRKVPLMAVARTVGLYIEDQDRIERWLLQDKDVATTILKMASEKSTYRHRRAGVIHKMNNDGFYESAWTNEERIHVGLKMIDLIIINTGVLELTRVRTSRNKTTTYLIAQPITLEWIKGFHASHRTSRPRFAPCVIPPKRWEGLFGGGYYIDELNNLPLVRMH